MAGHSRPKDGVLSHAYCPEDIQVALEEFQRSPHHKSGTALENMLERRKHATVQVNGDDHG
jgi:hypothetical protein